MPAIDRLSACNETGEVTPDGIASYLGCYESPALGEVSSSMRGDKLNLDAGGVISELRPLADGNEETNLLFHDSPLSLFSEAYGATVTFAAGDEPRMTIEVPASVTGPEQEFAFNRVNSEETETGLCRATRG